MTITENHADGTMPPLPAGMPAQHAESVFHRWRTALTARTKRDPDEILLGTGVPHEWISWRLHQEIEANRPDPESRALSRAYNAEMMKVSEPLRDTTAENSEPEDRLEAVALMRAVNKRIDRRSDEILDEKGATLPHVVSGAWLREQVFQPVRFAVPMVVPEGLTLVSGAPKAGKSFLVLSWALAIATGTSASGFAAQPARPVLYLALEDGYPRLQSRSVDLFGQVPDSISFVIKATPAEARAICVDFLGKFPGGVVFIDMLAKVRPPKLSGEAAYDYDGRTLGAYQDIARSRPGSAIVIVHHTRKDKSGDFLDAINGTYGVSGAIDTALVLYRDRQTSDGKLMVTGRDVESEEFLLSGFPYWKLAGGDPASARLAAEQYDARANVGDRSFQILSKIDEQGRITTAEAAQLLGLTSSQAATYLSRLADSGKIRKDGRGVYVSSVVSVGSVALYPDESHKATLTTPDTCAGGFDLQKLWEMSRKF